jgi:hypothetical protein
VCYVLFERCVLFCVICVFLCCLIVVPLSLDKNPFSVQLNNNNNTIKVGDEVNLFFIVESKDPLQNGDMLGIVK